MSKAATKPELKTVPPCQESVKDFWREIGDDLENLPKFRQARDIMVFIGTRLPCGEMGYSMRSNNMRKADEIYALEVTRKIIMHENGD